MTRRCLPAHIEGVARRTLQRGLRPAGVRQRRSANGNDPLWELFAGEGGKTGAENPGGQTRWRTGARPKKV